MEEYKINQISHYISLTAAPTERIKIILGTQTDDTPVEVSVTVKRYTLIVKTREEQEILRSSVWPPSGHAQGSHCRRRRPHHSPRRWYP